ncbi:MAG: hypothetical protein EAZ47_01100 [Bacteroidetes bacterium]|nr:MAG: hypothetical protein EAY72_01050 [Bacteroidota bacterium]TAF98059.1 MAG: hypothetical protein EAZ47_01100 [Bacteroidota bacterium]
MKNIMKLLTLVVATSMMLASCYKTENKLYAEGSTAPVISADRAAGASLVADMRFANRDNNLIRLNWTNPNYQFTTGISSQTVNYLLEIDTLGVNFSSPSRIAITYSGDLMKQFTVGELNSLLLNRLSVDSLRNTTIEVRVTASLANNALPVVSNTIRFVVRTFAIPPAVEPPAPQTLWITGAATPAGWMGGGDAPVAAQQFIRRSRTLYEIPSIALNGGAEYLLVPRYGNWSAVAPDPEKYGAVTNAPNPDSDNFRQGGNNLRAPAASGNYKIVVDFQRGIYTVTRL